jgi:plasmid stabilization system protein ParE
VASSVQWTLRAIQEAEEWINWLTLRNVKSAILASEELVRKTDRLAQFNELGPIGRLSGTRELSLPKWQRIVVYQILTNTMVILSVRDTRQDL